MFGYYKVGRIIRSDLDERIKGLCDLNDIRYAYTCAEEAEIGKSCRLWTFYLPKTCFVEADKYLRSEIRRIEKENPAKD